MSGDMTFSYDTASPQDPQGKVETETFQLDKGEVLLLVVARGQDGSVKINQQEVLTKFDISSHDDDARSYGGRVLDAVRDANK